MKGFLGGWTLVMKSIGLVIDIKKKIDEVEVY